MSRKSALAHLGLLYNCPHTDSIVENIICNVRVPKNGVVIDIGCGRGELICKIVEHFEGVVGLALDTNLASLSLVRIPCKGTVKIVEADLEDWVSKSLFENCKFDVIVCIGSLRAGKQTELIQKFVSLLNPGAYLVIGELVWVAEPKSTFLEFLETKTSDYLFESQLMDTLRSLNLETRYKVLQSVEEYETILFNNIKKWAEDNPGDGERDAILGSATAWYNFSSKHAWNTWEFATVVVQLPL